MQRCWAAEPNDRPDFASIIEEIENLRVERSRETIRMVRVLVVLAKLDLARRF